MKPVSRFKVAATVFAVIRASARPGAPSVAERAACVPRLVRHTLDRSYRGTTPGRLALVAAAAAYIASPVDLVPESVLPVIGLTDDAVVLGWAVKALVEETDRFLAWEASRAAWRPTPGDKQGTTPSWTSRTFHAPWPGESSPRADRDATGAAAPAAGSGAAVRDAAKSYVVETVRRRLER